MIAMLISGSVKAETDYICRCTRDCAGLLSEEYWEIKICRGLQEVREYMRQKPALDMICIDITVKNAVSVAESLRAENRMAYMILVADLSISPAVYMKPSIMAGSLMLKPLSKTQIQRVVKEAVGEFMKRFLNPDQKKVFVLENKEGRMLVEYERIGFFESRDKKIYLNTSSREYGFYDTLDHLEEQLGDSFLRCHRSFLVNRSKVGKVLLGQNLLILENETEIPISRTYRQIVKERCV